LETAFLSFGAYSETGCIGNTAYSFHEVNAADLRAINALADFAEYAGVGAKTSMGMGQARRKHIGSTLRGGAGFHSQEGE
jgi:CRISPR/Cas system endoribonuclease Cas6 (RAMP superfamily)